MLGDRARALRHVIQSAFDVGGLEAICELCQAGSPNKVTLKA